MVSGAGVVALAALFCLGGAAIDDVRRFAIADAWSLAIAALFAAHACLLPPTSWWSPPAAAGVVFGIGLIGFGRGLVGGGDVKLLTAIALWTGLDGLPELLAGTAIAGGVAALGLIAARSTASATRGWRLLDRNAPVPYAVAIAAGALGWAWHARGLW